MLFAFCFILLHTLLPLFDNGFISIGILATGNLAALIAATAAPAAIILITPNTYRAMATALYFFTINIIGMIAGSYLVAVLTENIFNDSNSIAEAITIVATVSWVTAVLILLIGF